MVLACVCSDRYALAATRRALELSRAVHNKVPTSAGPASVEAHKVRGHIRSLKARIASARQSADTLRRRDLEDLRMAYRKTVARASKRGSLHASGLGGLQHAYNDMATALLQLEESAEAMEVHLGLLQVRT